MSESIPERKSLSNAKSSSQELLGVALGFAAFLIWGLFPLYFYLLREVSPLVTLSFRAVFTTALLIPIVFFRGKGPAIIQTLRRPRLMLGLFATMATTAASWGFFIWLVAINHTLYASLGNYACPLVSVALGAIIFKERHGALTWFSIALAVVAVVIFALGVGRLPWESVIIAFVFAIYSALRKAMNVDSTTALSVETIFALPIGIGYILWSAWNGGGARPEWSTSPYYLSLLVGAGILTAIPLLLFGSAVTRVKLSTLGLLDYLCPTGQFLCGVCVFHESTTIYQWLSFSLVWIALTFFTIDLFRAERRERARRLSSNPVASMKTN